MDLNDDTIMTRDSLKNMVKYAERVGDVIVNPVSNCEDGWYDFYGQCQLNSFPKKRYMRMPDVAFREQEYMAAQSLWGEQLLLAPSLCMYATLIPTKAWRTIKNGTQPDAIGFDEHFKTGQDDIDYSNRAHADGYKLGLACDAIVWHFGGVNSSSTIGDDLRRENVDYYMRKWKTYPPGMTKESVNNQWGITAGL